MKKLSEKLNNWYILNARYLIWRKNKDPYSIWLSEIIMQQTRVDQGTPYYLRFIKQYPNIQSLAKSSEEKVLKLWQGLGYYSRGRNLLKCAQQIVNEHNGEFPKNAKALKLLPGIGDYTSAAISSIAFEEAVPSIDGNMIRVGSRIMGIKEEFPSKIAFQKLGYFLNEFIKTNKPSMINQAMMELGALVCKPTNPLCSQCPFKDVCISHKENNWDIIPLKKQKKKPEELKINFLDLSSKNKRYLIKRDSNSIWANLYEFPNYQGKDFNLEESLQKLFIYSETPLIIDKKTIKHQLSHRTIFATFWEISLKNIQIHKKTNIFEVNKDELNNYPIHRLMEKYLEYNDQ